MKIVEIKCKKCDAELETLESIPKDALVCPACGSKELTHKITDKEFEGGCSGNCSGCSQEH